MKAVLVRTFGPFEQAAIGDLPDPTAGPGEVVVAVKAAEANYADILVMEGSYQVKPPLPFVPGKAAAGVVDAVGDGVRHLKPGDRVAVQVEHGAYGERLALPAALCFPVPDGIGFDKAAALSLAYQTAHFALVDRAGLRKGDHVLVLGASGGVGIASLQLAKALGAGVVIGGTRGPESAEIVLAAGADHAVDLAMDNLRDGLREAVHAVTGGHGVDLVIDPVGGAANAAALRALAWRGRLVIVGFTSGEIPAIRANYLLVKNIGVSGLQWSDYRERDPAWIARVQQEIFDLALQGKLDPPISARFALADYAKALALLRDGKAQGKIVLTVGD
jgi:NADPH2:quinone reductase